MPQMMPLGWAWITLLTLFIYFIYLVVVYFLLEVNSEDFESEIFMKELNWKW